MTNVLRLPLTWVWFALAGITGVSWYLGAAHGVPPTFQPDKWVTIGVMVFAFVKVRLIVFHFMEVRHAPWVLKAICDAWVAIVCGAVLVMYLFA